VNVEEALDRLYGVPLEEFTATRNAIAKELADAGDDATKTVKALKKPNLAAWALNQLARKHADRVGDLIESTERLRHEQRKALSRGRAGDLREASDARGRIVSQLTKLAAQILTDAGHSAAQTTLSAISASLVAIAANDDATEQLRKGRLERELRAESSLPFEGGGGLTLIEGEAQGEAQEEEREDGDASVALLRSARTAVAEARKRVEETTKAARDAEAEARRLLREAEDAERSARAAGEAAEFAHRAAQARSSDATEAAEALTQAQRALRDAEKS
jgi:hypothetical protein